MENPSTLSILYLGLRRNSMQKEKVNQKIFSQMVGHDSDLLWYEVNNHHQHVQVPKMEVLNLIKLFCGWVFPYISRIHTANIGKHSSIWMVPEMFGDWRIILVSNWLVTPIYKPKKGHEWKGSNNPRSWGLTITMVTNYLLNGMILQVGATIILALIPLLHRSKITQKISEILATNCLQKSPGC